TATRPDLLIFRGRDKRKKKRYAKVGDTACPASAKKQNGKPNKPVQLQISVKPIPAPPPLTMSKTQNLAPSQVKKSVKPTPASPLPTMSKTQDLASSQVKNSVKPIPPPSVVAMSTPNKNPAPASPLPTLLKNPKIRLPIQIEVVSKQTDAMGRSARQCSSKCGMEANDIDSGRGSVNECDDSIPLSSDDLQQHSGSEHGCDFLEDDDNNSDKQESGRSAHKEDDNTMLTSTSQGDQLEQHQLTDEKSVTLADVMTELKKINSKLEFLGINQENLCRHVLPGQKYTKRPSGMPNLPVNSLKEVKALEDFLSNDGNLSSAITYYSKFLSKGDLGKSVRTLLGKMIEKNLARYFTQTGENGKQSFQSTKMWDLITGSLLTAFEGSEMKSASHFSSRWLTNSGYQRKAK
ncbi:GMP synthase [glutamine-hydrolyzing], partial [Frankliniella fusca]